MKKVTLVFGLLITQIAFADVTFNGQPAMDIFKSLTGPKVQSEGAMGSSYLTGKSIVCRGPNDPEMQIDPANYSCKLRINSNGKILTPRD